MHMREAGSGRLTNESDAGLRKKEESWMSGLSNQEEWCCHLHRGKTEAKGQESGLGLKKRSKRHPSVNVK